MIGMANGCLAVSPEGGHEDWYVTYRGSVDAWECDQMGHLNMRFYGRYFSMAEAWVFRSLPCGGSGVRIGTERIAFAAELRSGTPISVRSYKSSTGSRPVLHHELCDYASGRMCASIAIMYVLDAGSNQAAASAAERALSCLPLHQREAEALGGDRRSVRRR